MPKCEIFDRSGLHDFYTMKSVREGDFGVKKIKRKIFRGLFGAAIFLTHMLSSVYFEERSPFKTSWQTQELMRTLSIWVRN